jgi:hypothetical protein
MVRHSQRSQTGFNCSFSVVNHITSGVLTPIRMGMVVSLEHLLSLFLPKG